MFPFCLLNNLRELRVGAYGLLMTQEPDLLTDPVSRTAVKDIHAAANVSAIMHFSGESGQAESSGILMIST